MCLILVAWRKHPQYPLVVAANRDELHARPSERAGFWRDQPQILAGRDLEAKGTWLGVSRSGRFAAVTNYRGGRDPEAKESRGALVTRFLLGDSTEPKGSYSGFNLLAADRNVLHWRSNRDGAARTLEPGFYALGNLLLDTPEVADVKARFEGSGLAVESLFALLATAKIVGPEYGTRCSTVVLAGADGRVQFAERTFDPAGADGSTLRYEFNSAG